MPVMAAITLNSLIYTPRGKQGDVANWTYPGGASFGGAKSVLTESVRGPNSKSGISRVQFKLVTPKLATVDSACGCIGTKISEAIADIQVTVPEGFTLAERQDLCLRIQGVVAHAVFTAAVGSLESSW